jgi:cytochrome c5
MSFHPAVVSRFLRLVPPAFLIVTAACDQWRSASATPPGSTNPEALATGDAVALPDARADALLLAAAKVALPPPGIGPADLPDPHSAGAALVAQLCSQCHAIPSPAMHSATDWPRVARRMWLRMERLPESLTVRTGADGERSVVLGYLTANALQVGGTELPRGRGREDFALVCSRCHALPDIRLHTSGDWPDVFMRMERNMERMSVSLPSRAQTDNILLYLQDVAHAE